MKIYPGNKVLLSFRIPHAWKKVLDTVAKGQKTTMSNVISEVLEKKFYYAKVKESSTKRDN
jgi:predicted DNA-binding protein